MTPPPLTSVIVGICTAVLLSLGTLLLLVKANKKPRR